MRTAPHRPTTLPSKPKRITERDLHPSYCIRHALYLDALRREGHKKVVRLVEAQGDSRR